MALQADPNAENPRFFILFALILVLFAIGTQLAASGGPFFADDWSQLARAQGWLSWPELPARPFSKLLLPAGLIRIFGIHPLPWHLLTLTCFGLCALLSFRLAQNLGLRREAALAGALTFATTPLAFVPIFWWSAGAEIFALLFGLVAFVWWREGRMALALAALALSVGSKETCLFLPLLFVLFPGAAQKRSRGWGVAAFAVSAAAALLVWRAFPHASRDAYALGNPLDILENLGRLGATLLWPWGGLAESGKPAALVGGLLWLGWIALAVLARRKGEVLPGLALLWSLGSLLPTLSLSRHLEEYYALGAMVGLAWTLAWLGRGLFGRRAPIWLGLLALILAVANWSVQVPRLSARTSDGVLADRWIRPAATSRDNLARLEIMPHSPPIAILQASRSNLPESLDQPEQAEILVNSPIYHALDGRRGPDLMLGRGRVQWLSHLDGLKSNTQVFLDDGSLLLRPLGDLRNARIYAAVIAVAAKQFERARHELWAVGVEGVEVAFHFDPDSMPVDAAELESQAKPFLAWLGSLPQNPAHERAASLFLQICKALLGAEPLPWN